MKFQITVKTRVPQQQEIGLLFDTIIKTIDKKINGFKKHVFDVIFVNNEEMCLINFKYRHINKPADVISFAFHDKNPKTNLLGELYINWDCVVEQANLSQCTNLQEVCLLFIHGVLHLLGFNHENEVSEQKMFSLQKEIFEGLKF